MQPHSCCNKFFAIQYYLIGLSFKEKKNGQISSQHIGIFDLFCLESRWLNHMGMCVVIIFHWKKNKWNETFCFLVPPFGGLKRTCVHHNSIVSCVWFQVQHFFSIDSVFDRCTFLFASTLKKNPCGMFQPNLLQFHVFAPDCNTVIMTTLEPCQRFTIDNSTTPFSLCV